jgi:hypothetical protein
MRKPLYQDEAIRFVLDAAVPCLEWETKRPLSSEEARRYATQSMQLRLEQQLYPQLNVLLNIRLAAARDMQDFLWYLAEHMQKAYASGLRKIAIVLPENPFGQASYETFIGVADGQVVQHQVFDTAFQAKEWLRQ